jgi:putative iron-regulated protein
MKYLFSLLIVLIVLNISSCSDDNNSGGAIDTNLNAAVLNDFSANVASAKYNDLQSQVSKLYTQVLALELTKTEANLNTTRQTWRDARKAWEQSEAHLFGPVATENIDPRIDTWPVNFADLDAQLASSNSFTETYIDNLEDALKGFHPIEYLLFGTDGNRTAIAFTQRELEYLKGLTLNLKKLTTDLNSFWDASKTDSYYTAVVKAGNGSAIYTSQRAALEELVSAMAGICDEVANGKITEPFLNEDPTLEESPYAKSSIPDFVNNITGVQNVYLGRYAVDGKGLEDLVKKYNLSLDGEIKIKIAAAIAALNNVTEPFGQAIFTQKIQVQNAIDAINDLKDILEGDLMEFVSIHAE